MTRHHPARLRAHSPAHHPARLRAQLRALVPYALAAYTLLVLAVTLWPEAPDKPVTKQIRTVIDKAHEAGAPPRLGYNLIEYSANFFLFLPIGILLAILLTPKLWWFAPVVGMTLTFAIEFIQSNMPGRHASHMDVLYNTLGTLGGALIVVAARWLIGRRHNAAIPPDAPVTV